MSESSTPDALDAVKEQSEFIELAECPADQTVIDNGMAISDTEFIVTSDDVINKYNISTNEWSKWFIFSNYDLHPKYYTTTYNKHTKYLYIYENKRITKINTINKSYEIFEPDYHYDGAFASSTIIDNKLNIFGGWQHTNHIIWNEKTNELIKIGEYPGTNTFGVTHQLIYIKSKQLVLLLDDKELQSFSTKTNEWNQISPKMPSEFQIGTYALTKDEQYILMFTVAKKMYVLDVNQWKYYKCSINMIDSGWCSVITMDYNDRKEILINGYIRLCWQTKQFLNVLYPSNDIIGIIMMMYCDEYIHLIQRSGTKHWKISLNKILDNIQQ